MEDVQYNTNSTPTSSDADDSQGSLPTTQYASYIDPEGWYYVLPEEANKVLGKGGFGRVITARRTDTGSPCAVKLIAHANKDSYLTELQFYKHMSGREDSWMPKFSQLHGRTRGGDLWFMLELLDKDLHHVLRASDPSSTSISFVHVANECLSAVSALHEEGFIHRDVKPPNFVLRRDSQDDNNPDIVLIDFGLVTEFSALPPATKPQENQRFHGTVEYASYRQLYRKKTGLADDLESLGYTLAEFYLGAAWWEVTEVPQPWDQPFVREAALVEENRRNGLILSPQRKRANPDASKQPRAEGAKYAGMADAARGQIEAQEQAQGQQRPQRDDKSPREQAVGNPSSLKQTNQASDAHKHAHRARVQQPIRPAAVTPLASHKNERAAKCDSLPGSVIHFPITTENLRRAAESREKAWNKLVEQGDIPPFLAAWVAYCRSLQCWECPDYAYLKSLIKAYAEKQPLPPMPGTSTVAGAEGRPNGAGKRRKRHHESHNGQIAPEE